MTDVGGPVGAGVADAEVVPYADLHGTQALAAAAMPALTAQPYNPARDRERMRSKLGGAIIAAAMVAAAAVLVASFLEAESKDVIMAVFTALIGLAGTVLGFYFGGTDSTT